MPSRYCNATSSTLENEVSAGTQCCTCDRVLQPVGLHRQTKGFKKTSVVMFTSEIEVESERELHSHDVAHAQHAHVCLNCDTLAFGVIIP